MIFILYKLYILSTYTNSTPKPIHHIKKMHFYIFKKTFNYFVYTRFSNEDIPKGWILEILES